MRVGGDAKDQSFPIVTWFEWFVGLTRGYEQPFRIRNSHATPRCGSASRQSSRFRGKFRA